MVYAWCKVVAVVAAAAVVSIVNNWTSLAYVLEDGEDLRQIVPS
jgi:hypothetical protein